MCVDHYDCNLSCFSFCPFDFLIWVLLSNSKFDWVWLALDFELYGPMNVSSYVFLRLPKKKKKATYFCSEKMQFFYLFF